MQSRPKLGQNFLVDPSWQKKIVSAFKPPARFGEIGPGKGALTNHLQNRFSDFYIFEIDEDLIKLHRDKPGVHIIAGDFLNWDFKIEGKAVENFSFISNLPYEAGTAILMKVLEHSMQVPHFVFMLQREVVERIIAKPSSKIFGALSVLAQGQYNIESLGIIKPGAFSPPPKVDSMLIRGFRREQTHPNSKAFRDFVFAAFQFKRKTLRNCLRENFDSDLILHLYSTMGFDESVRAEEIAVEHWPKMYEILHEQSR